ncbi:MAG: hypothetical protein CHH17_18150 [Candidatus Fluviicola riflensis]|nr:MAG: hypothetical protein CHH17_18150 [Candidatus Fluviicola riflensis]
MLGNSSARFADLLVPGKKQPVYSPFPGSAWICFPGWLLPKDLNRFSAPYGINRDRCFICGFFCYQLSILPNTGGI